MGQRRASTHQDRNAAVINDRAGSGNDVRADLSVSAQWKGGQRFTAGKAWQPAIHIDGSSKEGPSPPEVLLCSLATCTAIDILLILEKRRTPAVTLDVDVTAERADRSESAPRRITKAHLGFRITGDGIERAQAERAVELAVTKYCTVRDTLDPVMPVTWALLLNGA